MNDTRDLKQAATADNGGALDPREAARLLEQTSREARRQFDPAPPLLTALMGAVILVAYGALWLSVLGQHPYTGPNLGVIALVYVTVAITAAVTVRVHQRATSGVSGPSTRQRTVEGIAVLVSIVGGSPVIQGALKEYGASAAIVYGVIQAAAPLIIVGTTVAGIAGSKSDWPSFGAALAVVAGGVVALFVGPIDAWLVAGISLFVGVVGFAAATAWQIREASRA
jgi:hypothetical protein